MKQRNLEIKHASTKNWAFDANDAMIIFTWDSKTGKSLKITKK